MSALISLPGTTGFRRGSANHRWAMARGLDSIRLEIARWRAAGDPVILAVIPPPLGPTSPHNLRRRG